MLFAPVPGRADPDREAALRAGSERQGNGQADRPGQGHRQPRAETGTVVRVQRERVIPPPDREAALRAGSERQGNGQADRPGQGHRQPRAETGTVVRVQRERVIPPVPAAAAEDRAVDVHAVLLRPRGAAEGRPYRPRRLKTGPWTSMPFYSALAAQRRADPRRHESRKPHRMDSDRLRPWVMDAPRRGWSPELIEGRLKLEYPGDPVMRVSHECLHQWIYAKPQRDLDLRQYLPRGKKHRARRKGRKVRGPRIPIVFLQVGVHSMGTIFRQHRRCVSASWRPQYGHYFSAA